MLVQIWTRPPQRSLTEVRWAGELVRRGGSNDSCGLNAIYSTHIFTMEGRMNTGGCVISTLTTSWSGQSSELFHLRPHQHTDNHCFGSTVLSHGRKRKSKIAKERTPVNYEWLIWGTQEQFTRRSLVKNVLTCETQMVKRNGSLDFAIEAGQPKIYYSSTKTEKPMLAFAVFDQVASKKYIYAVEVNEVTAIVSTEVVTWWWQSCIWHDSKLVVEQ